MALDELENFSYRMIIITTYKTLALIENANVFCISTNTKA